MQPKVVSHEFSIVEIQTFDFFVALFNFFIRIRTSKITERNRFGRHESGRMHCSKKACRIILTSRSSYLSIINFKLVSTMSGKGKFFKIPRKILNQKFIIDESFYLKLNHSTGFNSLATGFNPWVKGSFLRALAHACFIT